MTDKACSGDANTVKSVYTKSGADLGLPGTRLFPGQVISAPAEDVDVDLKDGTRVRLEKGARVRLECLDPGPGRPLSQRISLLVGTVWAKVSSALGADRDFQVTTQFSGAGARGTDFWMTCEPSRKRTTLRVVHGVVSFRRRRAPGRAILVRAGRTAIHQGDGAPRLVRG